jgi:hypothetical protein
LQNSNLVENTVSATYIESKINGASYCKTNGQFTRHLKSNNLTYQAYYETYVTKVSPKCDCGAPLTFYQKTETYANSCGDPKCVGNTISKSKQGWTEEQRLSDSINKKLAAATRTKENIKEKTEKARQTFKKKYGVDWISSHDSQKEKSKKTKLEKYGNEKYNNSKKASKTRVDKSVKEKNVINQLRRSTNLERYGVENVLLTKTTPTKINKGNSSIKDYQLPSGKTIGVRGHEPLALRILFKELKYQESDAMIHDDYSDYAIEVFEFVNTNMHTTKYYPDIYIPKENKIIEVKSQWWWDGYGAAKYKSRLENNLRKRQAVLDKGYAYEVWIFENKHTYRVLKDDKDF